MKHLPILLATLMMHSAQAAQKTQQQKLPRFENITTVHIAGIAATCAAIYVGVRWITREQRVNAFRGATTQKYEQVKALVQQDPTMIDKQFGDKQETALHGAVRNKDSAMVKLLLELGASTTILNTERQTAGDLAFIIEDKNTLQIFFDKGLYKQEKAQWDFEEAICQGDAYGADLALCQGAEVNRGWRATMKGSLLHRMVRQRGIEAVKALLECGIDCTIQDEQGKTAEQLLEKCKDKRGKEIARLLQEYRERKEKAQSEQQVA